MASQDTARKTEERVEASLDSNVYRVFGFGIEAVQFARKLVSLEEKLPAVMRRIDDIADRVAFVDFLRFETGWRAEETGSVGGGLRLGGNLDALETYLLCTCIDALAGGRKGVSFADWVNENPRKVQEAFGDRDSITVVQYGEVTKVLLDNYRRTGSGLSRDFLGFFGGLPPFARHAIAASFVLIEGDYLSETGRQRLTAWRELPEEEKIETIARDYLYGLRRSRYTHWSHRYEAALPGHWRRSAERGALPSDFLSEGWQATYLMSTKDLDKIKYTLFTPASSDENLVLRAAIAVHVLALMQYDVDESYWEGSLAHYRAISAIYAFLHEMEVNQARVDYLTSGRAVTGDVNSRYFGLPGLSTSYGDILLKDFRNAVSSLAGEISGYLHWATELNRQIREFNSTFRQGKDSPWLEQQRALAAFSERLSKSNELNQLHGYHPWIYSNLKRDVEVGQVHYGSSDKGEVH